MKALVAALNRIAAALEQLVPALTQATREHHYTTTAPTYVRLYDTEPFIFGGEE